MKITGKLMSLVALTAVVALSMSVPTAGFAGCTIDLVECFDAAANESTFIRRAAAGLDCELEFAGCVRKTIIGV